jgi:procollagen-lysine,2-oxoglutarate 5-dioxygenase
MVDKNVEVITISTDNKFYYPNLVESCRKNKGKLTTLGMGEKWQGYNWKFKKMLNYLTNLSDDKIVCFVDGYDVISCRDLTELAYEFIKLKNKYKCKIIAGCDEYGFIGKKIAAHMSFGKCDNHYLNSGTYIGYVKDLKDIISKIYELNPSDSADDQVLMIQYYNKHPGEIHIDHECKLFLTLMYPLIEVDYFTSITINNNKLHAIDYKSMPFFVHAPGNGFLNNIIIKLGYGTPDSDVKKNLTYAMADKLCYHLKRLFIDYKYIFLSIIVILVVISFTITKNIIKKKSIISIKNKKNKT